MRIALPVRCASETDLLEGGGWTLAIDEGDGDRSIVLDFRPFEIKTLRLAR